MILKPFIMTDIEEKETLTDTKLGIFERIELYNGEGWLKECEKVDLYPCLNLKENEAILFYEYDNASIGDYITGFYKNSVGTFIEL